MTHVQSRIPQSLLWFKICRTNCRGTDQTPSAKQPEAEEIRQAKLRWMRNIERTLPAHKDFPAWKYKLALFKDVEASCSQNPILFNKDHHLTSQLVRF